MARFDNVIVGGGLAAGMVAQEYRGAERRRVGAADRP